MSTIRTGNKRRRKAHRAQVLKDAFDYDMKRIARLTASNTMHKRVNSRFVRRWRQRQTYDRFMSLDTILTALA